MIFFQNEKKEPDDNNQHELHNCNTGQYIFKTALVYGMILGY